MPQRVLVLQGECERTLGNRYFNACSCSQRVALSCLWEWALERKMAEEFSCKFLFFSLPNNTDPKAFHFSFLLSFGIFLDE